MKDKHHNLSTNKLPPQVLHLEEVVLGALLLERDAYYKVSDVISTEDFYKESNRIVFSVIAKLHSKNLTVDTLTVIEELTRERKMDAVGGYSALSDLTNNVASAGNIKQHAKIIKQMSIKRDVIASASKALNDAYDPAIDVEDLISSYQDSAETISSNAYSIVEIADTKGCIDAAMADIEDRKFKYDNNIKTGVPTGNDKLDAITGCYQKGEFIVVAARPSVGKSLFAVQSMNESMKSGIHTVMFSLEMTKVEVMQRMMTSYGVNGLSIRDGKVNQADLNAIGKFKRDFADKPLHIIDKPGITIEYVKATAKNIHRKEPIGILFIDYIQLLRAPGHGNRLEEVTYITAQLKELAKQLQIPIVALAQVNRESAKDGIIKAPTMAQLRESGSIEQDADKVILLHKENPKGDLDMEGDITPQDMIIIIEKNRGGENGIVAVTWGVFQAKMYSFHMSPKYTGIEEIVENGKAIEGILPLDAGMEEETPF